MELLNLTNTRQFRQELVAIRKAANNMTSFETSRFGTYYFSGVVFNGTQWVDGTDSVDDIEWCHGNPTGNCDPVF